MISPENADLCSRYTCGLTRDGAKVFSPYVFDFLVKFYNFTCPFNDGPILSCALDVLGS